MVGEIEIEWRCKGMYGFGGIVEWESGMWVGGCVRGAVGEWGMRVKWEWSEW